MEQISSTNMFALMDLHNLTNVKSLSKPSAFTREKNGNSKNQMKTPELTTLLSSDQP